MKTTSETMERIAQETELAEAQVRLERANADKKKYETMRYFWGSLALLAWTFYLIPYIAVMVAVLRWLKGEP